MSYAPILGPVVALVAWTMLMGIWLYATRLPAMRRAGIELKGRVGARGADLDGKVDAKVQWKAHNYNHLMEQPTLFYAVAIGLAMLNDHDPMTTNFGWAYVGLRVLHSLVQATVNIVKYRLALFLAGSVVLLLLTLRLIKGVIILAGG
jgi:hypothetical protein